MPSFAGAAATIWDVTQDWPLPAAQPWLEITMLAIALVAAEAMQISVGHGRRSVSMTFSGGLAFALVLIAPLGVAISVQVLAVTISVVRNRYRLVPGAFNVAAQALSLHVAGTVLALLSAERFPLLTMDRLGAQELLSILLAGAAHYSAQHVLAATAAAIANRQPLLPMVIGSGTLAHLPYLFDLAVAPIAIAALALSPWLMPLLLLPQFVLFRSARLAARREHEALHDVLTGLGNRAFVHSAFEEAGEELARGSAEMGIVLLDLDHFKQINDTLGHHAGDLLLQEVAHRLSSVTRERDVVARLGGDEFVVLAHLTPGTGEQEVIGLADRIVRLLSEPVLLGGVHVVARASAGIAICPQHGTDLQTLMGRADVALYVAKEERGRAAVYEAALERETPERLELLAELRDGMDRGEMVVHYQPRVELSSGAVTRAEALLRWQHPTRGLLAPEEFMTLAETTGLIVPLTTYVLESALVVCRSLIEQGRCVGVVVNLSVRHLTDMSLPDQIASALADAEVPASSLTLEATESAMLHDRGRSGAVLRCLRDLGVRIAVDDYGAGRSSLADLRDLPLDELQISRAFVIDLVSHQDADEVIVRSAIELGHNLGLRVVAEGVESPATVGMLGTL